MKATTLHFLVGADKDQLQDLLFKFIEIDTSNTIDAFVEQATAPKKENYSHHSGCYSFSCYGVVNTIRLSDRVYNEALAQAQSGNRVSAIKFIRDMAGLSLKEAMAFVEQQFYIQDSRGVYSLPNPELRPVRI
jgi:hypothetical protein